MPSAVTLAHGPTVPARPIIRARTVSRGLVLAGILLVALNLRAAITGLGALLPEVSQGLHLSGTAAGLVTTLPALSFAVFGAFTPHLTRRLGSTQILLGSMPPSLSRTPSDRGAPGWESGRCWPRSRHFLGSDGLHPVPDKGNLI